MDRIRSSNIDELINSKIINYAIDEKQNYSRIIFYGIVINNIDSLNANRIQVRIPFLDDIYYVNNSKTKGDSLLPWCNSFNRNFISTPENNSIVQILIFDSKLPYSGRIFLDCIPLLSQKDIFDKSRLTPETETYNNWNNAEFNQNLIINSKPKTSNEYNTKENIKYPVGLKGKGNNKIILEKDYSKIIQNEGMNTESSLLLNKDINILSSDNINIISNNGNSNHYHPVFDSPLYDYISTQNNVIKAIINVLNSVPSIAVSGIPNQPSPEAISLLDNLLEMYNKFNQLIVNGNGASNKIFIN